MYGDKAEVVWVARRANTHARIWAGGVDDGSARRRLLLLAEQERADVCGSLLLVVQGKSQIPVAAHSCNASASTVEARDRAIAADVITSQADAGRGRAEPPLVLA